MDNFGVRFADKIIIRREVDTVIVRFPLSIIYSRIIRAKALPVTRSAFYRSSAGRPMIMPRPLVPKYT